MKILFKHPFVTFSALYFINISVILFAICITVALADEQIETMDDSQNVHVLIDVSGSMKKTDPKNLRSPSLRLLVGLLPEGSKAAVWSFGTKVYEMVKSSPVNENWKQQANAASRKIHSKDLFTNIGQALSTASKDWLVVKKNNNTETETSNRNIILLTDGMVDISPDEKKNSVERKRILAELLPQIRNKQSQIHTIALSDQADFKFLKELSVKSDGSFEQAENAEALERLFLHLFEKATKPDTLPLVENNFIVDDSVYEMTLLVFKDKTAEKKETEIVQPSGKTFTKNTAPAYVKWQSENNYDLLTVQKPEVGDWKINANIDPDNRVMVVTNLKIQTNYLPNNVFLGEKIDVKISLSDQKEIITDDDFLQLTSVSVSKEENNQQPKRRKFLHDNGLSGDKKAHDGVFDLSIADSLTKGKNKYVIRASSNTFARELQQTFTVHDVPLLFAELEIIQKDGKDIKLVRVSPNLEYLNPKKIKVSAQLFDSNNKAQTVNLKNDNKQQLEWFFETDGLDPDEDYYIVFYMQSHSLRGRPINYISKKIQLNLNKIIASAYTESKDDQDIKITVSKPEKNQEMIIDDADETMPDASGLIQDSEATDENEVDWTMGIIIAVVVNIVVAILAWFFYRRWKNKQDTDLIDLTGEMG